MDFQDLGRIATEAGPLAGALCMPWKGEPPQDPTQLKIRELVEKYEESFSKSLTGDCLRVLEHLSGCRLCEPANLVQHVHTRVSYVDRASSKMILEEFEFRLACLAAYGLVSPAVKGTVCLSHLGKGLVRVFEEHGRLPRARKAPVDVVFIGSSSAALPVAERLKRLLRGKKVRSKVWNEDDAFLPGQTTIEGLEEAVKRFAFGVFVFTPDDTIVSEAGEKQVVRDNVLFELGLFIGKLSRARSFIVLPSDEGISLPSDLSGLTAATYEEGEFTDGGGSEDDWDFVLAPAVERIVGAISRVQSQSSRDQCHD